MDIKGLDKWFGILCLLTLLAGVVDVVVSFYFNTYITLIVTGVIWFSMAILWCWIAFKFRRMAFEFGCQKIEADIRDTLRDAIRDPDFVKIIDSSVSIQKVPIVVSVGERQFPVSSMKDFDDLKRELRII